MFVSESAVILFSQGNGLLPGNIGLITWSIPPKMAGHATAPTFRHSLHLCHPMRRFAFQFGLTPSYMLFPLVG